MHVWIKSIQYNHMTTESINGVQVVNPSFTIGGKQIVEYTHFCSKCTASWPNSYRRLQNVNKPEISFTFRIWKVARAEEMELPSIIWKVAQLSIARREEGKIAS